MVKLDAMENPYPLPEPLRASIARLVERAALNRYPDAAASDVQGAAARGASAFPPAWSSLLGNGSDELIQMLALAAARPGAVVLGVEPSFVMFRMIATFRRRALRRRGPARGLPARRRAPAGRDRAAPARRSIFIAYPNNPTGNLFDEALVARVIEAAPGHRRDRRGLPRLRRQELHGAACRAIPICSSCAPCPSSGSPACGWGR